MYRNIFSKKVKVWAKKHLVGIFIFNLVLMILVLLHSAGYFDPFLPLTINLIFLVGFFMSTFLLGANCKTLFALACIFWGIGAVFGIFYIDIWAERAGIYAFEALLVGIILFIVEILKDKISRKS